jgi:membrane protein implicated in regulation of membrane protease activity
MRKRLLVLVAIVILAIPLALLLRDFVRDLFLVELGRAIWVARLLFESLPQVMVWAVLVVALLALAVRIFRPRSRAQADQSQVPAEPRGRVHVLSRWIDRSAQSEYFRQSLAHELVGLTWEVMAHREHTFPDRLAQRLRAGELDLPPLVGDMLRSGQTSAVPPPPGFFSRVWQRLAPGRQAESDSGLDPALESLVEFLETQLEIYPRPVATVRGSAEHRGENETGPRQHERQSPIEG